MPIGKIQPIDSISSFENIEKRMLSGSIEKDIKDKLLENEKDDHVDSFIDSTQSLNKDKHSNRKESKESQDSNKSNKSIDLIGLNNSEEKEISLNDVSKFRISFCTMYNDFDSHSDKYHSDLVININFNKFYKEFNWEEQGYYILKDIYPSGVNALNNEINFQMNYNLKYFSNSFSYKYTNH